MKKVVLIFNLLMIALQASAQRYTGYGRGYDWGGSSSSDKVDLLFPTIILIVVVIGLIITAVDKIKDWLFPWKKGLVSLSKFKKGYTDFDRAAVVNNNNGDYFDICVFYKENYPTPYYIGISPYLKPPTYWKIVKMEEKFYVRWVDKAYMLCSKKSEECRFTDSDNSNYRQEELKIQNMIYELNKGGKEEDYTIGVIPRT